MSGALVSLLLTLGLAALFHAARSRGALASTARRAAGVGAVALGGALLLLRQVGLALALFAAGAALLAEAGRLRRGGRRSGGRRSSRASTVRSAVFEMTLDQETGEMDGVVRPGPHAGPHEGRRLSEMNRDELIRLAAALPSGDADSLNLLRAYLDRAHPGWAETAQTSAGGGEMTRAEALGLLGLKEGAGEAEIVAAHRRLSKRVHPDAGGTAALAAQINRAKDLLLG